MQPTISKPAPHQTSPSTSSPSERKSTISVGIVGLGYVGLPLSLQFAKTGVTVLGLDIDPAKVEALNQAQSYIKHIESSAIAEAVRQKTFSATTDFSRVAELDAVIICVPTPLNKNREPDISYILATGESIAPHLKKGALVVLESTTYPGTTDEDLRAVRQGMKGFAAVGGGVVGHGTLLGPAHCAEPRASPASAGAQPSRQKRLGSSCCIVPTKPAILEVLSSWLAANAASCAGLANMALRPATSSSIPAPKP